MNRANPIKEGIYYTLGILLISGLLTSRNFNCNLFRCEGQRHPGTGVDI